MSETVTVKVSTENPATVPLRQTPGGTGRWGRYQFVFDEALEACDYWVVGENLRHAQTTVCPPGNTVLLTWEPPSIHSYPNRYVRQFGSLITCHQDIKHPRRVLSQQGLAWFVDRDYDYLSSEEPVAKTRLLSVISSNKTMTPGHRRRRQFALRLKEYFGDEIDLFGRGIRDFSDKWDVLAPYKYSLALENSAYPHYFTEKLTDCFLCETFPFYYGAPNIETYFGTESFVAIDFEDFDATVQTIKRIVEDETHYARHLVALREAKRRCLDEYNLFPLLAAHIDKMRSEGPGIETTLRPLQAFDHKARRVAWKLKRLATLQGNKN